MPYRLSQPLASVSLILPRPGAGAFEPPDTARCASTSGLSAAPSPDMSGSTDGVRCILCSLSPPPSSSPAAAAVRFGVASAPASAPAASEVAAEDPADCAAGEDSSSSGSASQVY